ncbi:protein MIS12 homolog [Phalaenopsis equestris]|uniref:protein MIS12 homolog n=1 Tax=Phalaenopsis equestris TaxID=78828 RepID=UPI0009E2EEA7|nr:protein MIS12 homolog [Phalaenopsis equestris]
MEGSKGEEAFEALGLNPQLLINDILNMIDDMVESAFDFYHQEATKLFGSGGNGSSMRSDDLAKGISSLRCLVERALDKQTGLWERYCLDHCFSVPEGFVLPKNQDSSGNDLRQSDLSDEQLNMQLDDLRIKLAEAGKKNEELRREIHSLEKQARYDAAVVETMQLLEQNSAPQTFKEIKEAASKLQEKMLEAMTKMKKGAGGGLININMLKEGIWKQDEYLSTKLEEIHDVVQILKM